LKTIGVLGGLGPQATMDFESHVHLVAQRLIPPNANGSRTPVTSVLERHVGGAAAGLQNAAGWVLTLSDQS
jgi:hypothetical protein